MLLDLASLPRWAVASTALVMAGSRRACLVVIPAARVKVMPVWPPMTAWGQEATKADASNRVRSRPVSRQVRRMILHRRDAEQTGQPV
jgi:hypothetical protein